MKISKRRSGVDLKRITIPSHLQRHIVGQLWLGAAVSRRNAISNSNSNCPNVTSHPTSPLQLKEPAVTTSRVNKNAYVLQQSEYLNTYQSFKDLTSEMALASAAKCFTYCTVQLSPTLPNLNDVAPGPSQIGGSCLRACQDSGSGTTVIEVQLSN